MKKYTLPILFMTLMLDMVGIGMIIPIIPTIFTDPTSESFMLTGFDPNNWFFIAGLATAVVGLMQFLAGPILGELSDVYGRKKLLSAGVLILALSQFVFGFSILIKSLTLLFISRIIGGLAGANFSIAQATMADISTPETRAKNFGLIGAAFGIGFVVGPALGGYIAHLFDSAAAPFWVSGVLGILNFLSVTLFLKETHTENRSTAKKLTPWKAITNIKIAFTDKDLSQIYKANFFYYFGFAFFTSFSGLYLVNKYGVSEAGLGTYFAASGVCIIITQAIILRFVNKKYTSEQILKVTMICVALAIFALPFMPTLYTQYMLLPLIAVPQGLSMANLGALLSKNVSKENQGLALGINGSLSALSQGVVPSVAGVLPMLFGIRSPFIVGSFAIVIAWITMTRYIKVKNI
jgi:DHA1 family tetracycline resistance protein-like MFS transporter